MILYSFQIVAGYFEGTYENYLNIFVEILYNLG
jgi:hypothetical protein